MSSGHRKGGNTEEGREFMSLPERGMIENTSSREEDRIEVRER